MMDGCNFVFSMVLEVRGNESSLVVVVDVFCIV